MHRGARLSSQIYICSSSMTCRDFRPKARVDRSLTRKSSLGIVNPVVDSPESRRSRVTSLRQRTSVFVNCKKIVKKSETVWFPCRSVIIYDRPEPELMPADVSPCWGQLGTCGLVPSTKLVTCVFKHGCKVSFCIFLVM